MTKQVASSCGDSEIDIVELMTLFDPPYTHGKQTEIVQLMRGTAENCERNIKQWRAMWETYNDMITRHPKYMKENIPWMTKSMHQQSAAVIASMKLFCDDLQMLHEANGSLGVHERKRSRSRSRVRAAFAS